MHQIPLNVLQKEKDKPKGRSNIANQCELEELIGVM